MLKKRIVVSGLWYPVCIAKYFLKALRHRDDVELFTIGPYSGDRIPWGEEYRFPKYAEAPDCVLDEHSWQFGLPSLLPWIPDLVLQIDAGFFIAPPLPCPTAIVATDAHCLDYSVQRHFADHFFCMQKVYAKPGDHYLPYAYSEYDHYPETEPINYDVMLLGLQYGPRIGTMMLLKERGRRVFSELGYIFDEARALYAQTNVIFNWSSRLDTVARVWEAMAFGKCLVTNRTPDLPLHFEEGTHYVAFSEQQEAIEKIEWALAHPEQREAIARAGHEAVRPHTYDRRVQQILEVCELA